MPTEPYAVEDLKADLRNFRDERDWSKFHDPKSLILALVGEVGELAELFSIGRSTVYRALERAARSRKNAAQ